MTETTKPQPDRTEEVHQFTPAQEAYVEAYLARHDETASDLDRLVTTPCGLTHEEVSNVFAHPSLGTVGLHVMSDLMAPEGSMYFDAIFGANYGQVAIRNWLVPVMTESSFLEFRPTRPADFLDDGEGGTSLDEWVMVACVGDQELPLANGISVRRFRDGWIKDGIDVYDTMSTRTLQPPEGMEPQEGAPVLPPYPEMNWQPIDAGQPQPLSDAAKGWMKARQAVHASGADPMNEAPSGLSNDELHDIHNDPAGGMDFNLVADMMHPTDSLYIDPLFGRFEGQRSIRAWYTDIMSKVGNVRFEALAPIVWDGQTSLQMFQQVAVVPGGEKVEMTWGFSVRRFRDGWIVYAADYFDLAPLSKPEVLAASAAIGSRITQEDILRYRTPAGS